MLQNIMSIFGSKPSNVPTPLPGQNVQQNLAQQGQQAQITNNPVTNPPSGTTHQSQGVAPNGLIPEQKVEESPTQQFKDIWQPTPVDPNKKESPLNQFTSEHFMEAAGKINFTNVITPDQMQKIQAGGAESMQTLVEVMNKTAQVTMGQALAGANKLVDRKLDEARLDFNKNFSKGVRDNNVREQLFQTNKLLADPAVAPMVIAMQQQLSEKFPHASEQEIMEKAQQFVLAAGQAFAPAPKKEAPKVPANEDWSDLV